MKHTSIAGHSVTVGVSTLFIVLLGVGCSSSSRTSAPNIRVSIDARLRSSATIQAAGGVVATTGTDGTKFTLTVPKDALAKGETITLTPVTAMEGLPLSGGLIAAVQMAPDGLTLAKPATLSVESLALAASRSFQKVGFSYDGSGQGLFPASLRTNGNIATIEVWHFSGAGAAWGTTAELKDLFERSYKNEIAPLLPAALKNCEQAKQILPKALSWARAVQLLGFSSADGEFKPGVDSIFSTVPASLAHCYDEAYDKCVQDSDEKQLAVMLDYLRELTLLGYEDRVDQTKLERCPPGFKIDQAFGDGGRLSGWICSILRPFELQFSLEAATMTGVYSFSPSSGGDGTWSYSGTAAQGLVKNSGKGRFRVERNGTGLPVIQMDAGIMTQITPAMTASMPGKPQTLALQPAPDACRR